MPDKDGLLTDDAVAERLISEANDYALRFSALGADAGRERPENKPRPNKRFLRNIIRTTESHNAALLAREAAESQARLQDLHEAEQRDRRRRRPEPHEVRRRQMRDISAILHGGRAKSDKAAAAPPAIGSRSAHRLDSQSGDKDDARDHRASRERLSRDHHGGSCRRSGKERSHSHDDDRRRHRHRSSSPDGRKRQQRRSRRERSPLGGTSGDKDRHKRRPRHGHRARDSSRSKSSAGNEGKHRGGEGTEDSDPLDDVIGPLPPPSRPTRGRGNTAQASGIDARFSDSYNPASDVIQNDPPANPGAPAKGHGGDKWDDAVEAFRDRQKWKSLGAERLRAAGFTETQIQKWERGDGARAGGGADADIDDFSWSKKGEMRQWDRGKTVNTDGSVSTGPEWAK